MWRAYAANGDLAAGESRVERFFLNVASGKGGSRNERRGPTHDRDPAPGSPAARDVARVMGTTDWAARRRVRVRDRMGIALALAMVVRR